MCRFISLIQEKSISENPSVGSTQRIHPSRYLLTNVSLSNKHGLILHVAHPAHFHYHSGSSLFLVTLLSRSQPLLLVHRRSSIPFHAPNKKNTRKKERKRKKQELALIHEPQTNAILRQFAAPFRNCVRVCFRILVLKFRIIR